MTNPAILGGMEQTKFHGKAQAYAAGRPGYPAAAIACIRDTIGTTFPTGVAHAASSPITIAEIGAGTGKLTVPLAGLGLPVFAVEPDADMRGVLIDQTRALANVTVIDGTAAHTTLPSHSVDVIVVAQALHWFEPDTFAAECRRIARGGQYLLISLYNVTSFDSALKNDSPEHNAQLAGSIRHFSDTKAAFFRDPTVRSFPNPIRYTRESWRIYMDSHSHSPLPDSPDYPAHRTWVDTLFDDRAVDGILTDDTICMMASELVRFGE